MLQNARVTAFTVSEVLRKNQWGGGGWVKIRITPSPPPPPPRLGLSRYIHWYIDGIVPWCIERDRLPSLETIATLYLWVDKAGRFLVLQVQIVTIFLFVHLWNVFENHAYCSLHPPFREWERVFLTSLYEEENLLILNILDSMTRYR